ncbi:hypothetical protein [Lonepinella sp. BR2904]|uniref:hypothetical protein n=1 Tax=Lonepinella sp. BR2904 TaxID=3434551 RepID=UPI003F6DED81
MPMIIWTISDYFYHKQRALYFIKFKQEDHEKEEEMLLNWFNQNLPDVPIAPIFPFMSDEGILSGSANAFYIDFDEKSLAIFCERWEDGHDNSIDKRFQCYFFPLEDYKALYNGQIPNPYEFDYE